MNTDTITTRLHAKADADLKAKLSESVAWVWEQTGHSGHPNPKLEDFPDVASQYTNDGQAAPKGMPWIGRILELFKAVSFAYLRDKWRNRYVAEFLGKVEAMAAEMENLGIVIHQNEEAQQ